MKTIAKPRAPQSLVSRAKFAQLCNITPTSVTRACKDGLKPATVGRRIDINHAVAVDYRLHVESKNDPSVRDPAYADVALWCAAHNRYSVRGIIESGIVGRVRAKRILAELTAETGSGVRDLEKEIAPDVAPRPPSLDPAHTSGHTARNEKKKRASTTDPSATVEIPDNITAFADYTLRKIINRFGSDVMFVDFLKALKLIESINTDRLKNAQTEGILVARELVQIGVIDVVDTAMRKLLAAGCKKIARSAHTMSKAGETLEDIETEVRDEIGQYVKNIKVKSKRALDRG